MANVKWTEFPAASTISGSDLIPIVQSGTNKKATGTIFSTYIGTLFVSLSAEQTIAGVKTFSSQLASSVATGTAPFSIASTTKVTNLNADLLDGYTSADFQLALTNPITGTGTTNYLPKFTGASALGDSLIYDNGTNVGIGTTSPNGKLQVKSDTNQNLVIGTQGGELSFEVVNDAYSSNTPIRYYASTHNWYTGGVVKATLDANGSLGIGTTSPATIINANASSNTTAGLFIQNQTTPIITMGNEATWLGTGTSNNAVVAAFGSNSLLFGTNAAERMRITSAGNVGIGSTSPSNLLSVSNNNLSVISLDWIGDNNAKSKWSANHSTGEVQFYNFTNYFPTFYANGTERMRITSAGNVGIGCTDPTGKFEIRGLQSVSKDLLLNLSKFDYGATQFYQNYSNTFYSGGKSLEIEVEALPLLQLAVNNAGSLGKVIFPNGNVLIGTTTDAGYKLDVNSGSSNGLRFYGASAIATIQSTSVGNNADLRFTATSGTWVTGLNAYLGDGSYEISRLGVGNYFKIASSGAATFSSSVSMSTFGKITSITPYLELRDTNWAASTYVQTGVNVGATASGDYFNIYNPAGKGLSYVRGGNVDFSISPTGAATFSSSVTSSQYHYITNTFDGRGIYADDGYGSAIFSLTRESGNEVRLQSVGYLTFLTNGANERMRITSDGQLAVNTTSPDASALVQIDSTTQGFLVPRMGDAGINSISSPAAGLMVYNTDINHMCMFDGSVWKKFSMSNM